VARHEAVFGASHHRHPAAPVVECRGVEVLGPGVGVVEEREAVLGHPLPQVEVLVQEGLGFVEPVHPLEHAPLQRHIRRIEVPPPGLLPLDRAVVRLDSALEPAHEGGRPGLARPVHVTEHPDLGRGMAVVPRQVLVDQVR